MREFAYVISIPLSYLVGSIPFAYLAGKILAGKDLRFVGSGNLGTSNVFHEVSKKAGVAVFFLDCAKMGLTLLALRLIGTPFIIQSLCALAVMAGHNWSIFTGFKGGRGMAVTLIGSLIILPWETLVILAILLYGTITKLLSLYCGIALISWPIMALLRGEPWEWCLFAFGVMVLAFARRLQGSPEVSPYPRELVPLKKVIISRLIFDREYLPSWIEEEKLILEEAKV